MINRSNFVLSRKYLDYRKRVDQLSSGSLKIEKTYMRRILEWAGETSFKKIVHKHPTLTEYLLTVRLDNREGHLSHSYHKKILATARRFFTWLYEEGYRSIKPSWIKTLKTKRIAEKPKKEEVVSFDEIIQIASTPVYSTVERRIRAAACFLYLSGQRISAFTSMPIKAVDIENRTVFQHPDLGVKTKNRKHATTFLFPIPELLKVVSAWDKEIRSVIPENGFWFAPLKTDTGEIDASCLEIGEYRHTLARKNLRDWLEKNNLPYRSPHKFRHGHIHYGLEHAKDLEQYKAVSMNVMHANMTITDEIYSRLKDDTIKQNIDTLGKSKDQNSGEAEIYAQIQKFLDWQKNQGN